MAIRLHQPKDEGPSDLLVYSLCVIAVFLIVLNIALTLSSK